MHSATSNHIGAGRLSKRTGRVSQTYVPAASRACSLPPLRSVMGLTARDPVDDHDTQVLQAVGFPLLSRRERPPPTTDGTEPARDEVVVVHPLILAEPPPDV